MDIEGDHQPFGCPLLGCLSEQSLTPVTAVLSGPRQGMGAAVGAEGVCSKPWGSLEAAVCAGVCQDLGEEVRVGKTALRWARRDPGAGQNRALPLGVMVSLLDC